MDFKRKRIIKVSYDTAVLGLTQATYDLGKYLPANCMVTSIVAEENTVLTSGGSATLTLKAGSTSLSEASAYDTAFLVCKTITLASSLTAVKVSSASNLNVVVGGADLTAGKVTWYVEVVLL